MEYLDEARMSWEEFRDCYRKILRTVQLDGERLGKYEGICLRNFRRLQEGFAEREDSEVLEFVKSLPQKSTSVLQILCERARFIDELRTESIHSVDEYKEFTQRFAGCYQYVLEVAPGNQAVLLEIFRLNHGCFYREERAIQILKQYPSLTRELIKYQLEFLERNGRPEPFLRYACNLTIFLSF